MIPGITPIDPGVTQETQAFPWMAAVGAASSLIGEIFNIGSSRRQNKRMIEFWNMQNEYNHPKAQMARLQEAGLNPNLIYGSGASGASGNAGDVGMPSKPEITSNPIMEFQNANQRKLQSDNLRSQNTVLMNQAALNAARTMKELVETGIKSGEKKILLRTLEDQISQIQSESMRSLNRSEVEAQNLDMTRLTAGQRGVLRNQYFKSLINKFAQGAQDLSNKEKLGLLRDAELELKDKGLRYYDSQAILGILAKLFGVVK